jgi:hypothetical protein
VRSGRLLAAGALLYLAAALADAALTLAGLGGDLALEGNPVVRAAMAAFGPVSGLFIQKTATGLACLWLAWFLEPEIRRKAGWIDKVPATPWARAWYRRGDRWWLAFLPLYGTALSQIFAAASWLALRHTAFP